MSRGQVISNVTQTFKDNAEYTITPPQGFEAMEKATIIVDVEQPLVQNNKTQTITNPSETITIDPDEGYDALKKVTVTTNIPLQDNKIQTITNANETVTITPDTGYEALKQVTVTTNVPIPELETWNNKRFISTGTITVGNVMNDNTKAGISKQSTFVIDVPTPSITQIRNYPVTKTGTVNVPIPSGYDAVDSISLSVNVASKINLTGFKIGKNIFNYSIMTKGSGNVLVTVNDRESLIMMKYSTVGTGYSVGVFTNTSGVSKQFSTGYNMYYYLYNGVADSIYLTNNSSKNVLRVHDFNTTDSSEGYIELSKDYFVLNGITA